MTGREDPEWEAFLDGPSDGTLFHRPSFLAYHPEGRFREHGMWAALITLWSYASGHLQGYPYLLRSSVFKFCGSKASSACSDLAAGRRSKR